MTDVWQPIETAPKDGTPILVWAAQEPMVARFESGRWSVMWDGEILNDGFEPSCWSRLPAPPTIAEQPT